MSRPRKAPPTEEQIQQKLERRRAQYREQYRQSPEMRQAVKDRVKQARAQQRADRETRAVDVLGLPVQDLQRFRPFPPTRTLTVRAWGQYRDVLLFGIAWVSRAIERTTHTIRIWEREGQIPEAPYVDEQNGRWYTADQVRAALECARDLPNRRPGEPGVLADRMRSAWAKIEARNRPAELEKQPPPPPKVVVRRQKRSDDDL